MKNLFTSLLCLWALPALLFGQNALFPLENARWCYTQYGDLGNYVGTYCVGPDSLVELGGKTYARLIAEQSYLYREEAGKLYVIPQDSIQEYVVYDFNLNIGDTFQVKWGGIQPGGNPKLVVYVSETFMFADGVARKQLQLGNDNGNQALWVEGIGAEGTGAFYWHFLNPIYYVGVSGAYSLECFSVDSMPVYPDAGGAAACLSVATAEVSRPSVQMNLYPNPAGEDLFARFAVESARNLDFCLYNALGVPVWIQAARHYPPGEHTLHIDTKQLPAGMYALVLGNAGSKMAFSVAIR